MFDIRSQENESMNNITWFQFNDKIEDELNLV